MIDKWIFNPIGGRYTRASLVSLALVVPLLVALSLTPNAQAATTSWPLQPSSYDFGARLPGTGPSDPAVFTLTNTGEVQLPPPRVVLTSTGSGFFGFTASNCENRASLASAETCTVEVTFDPLYPGPTSGLITFTDPSSLVPPVSAAFSGLGIGPIVSFSPPLLSLGALIGERPSLPWVLTVANSGDSDLSISGISLINMGDNPNHLAIVGGSCHSGSTVASGASCTIQITVSPTQVGFHFGELQITDNAAHGSQVVLLQVIGLAPPVKRPALLAPSISWRPHRRLRRRFATFRFRVVGVHVQFACKLDRRPFRPCVSPTTYRNLAVGRHVFKVKTLSRTSGVSTAPAVARFQVIPRRVR